MELPLSLRRAVDQALDGVALADLADAAASLSQRYREQGRDGAVLIANRRDALAYIATRLPATYAALRGTLAAVAERRPDFAPKTLLDIGAGPGTTLWAAADCWPGLAEAVLLEPNPVFRTCGEALAADAPLPRATWRAGDAASGTIEDGAPRDLVVLSYVLNEIAPGARSSTIERLWRATADMLVIVEPGTPAGAQRIITARRALIAAGAHVLAPCPHQRECPLAPPDWCHFARRLPRSRLHRLVKDADVPWEDEKYSYLAVSRRAAAAMEARVLARPRKASGRVTLKLCCRDGSAAERLFSRRDGELYRRAARSDWGSTL
jgi:ribosomal protein RSM22 (predicted rRNA methylase)